MTEVGFGELVVRMIISLAIVLGLMFGAYAFMRRRQGYGGSGASARPPRRSGGGVGRGGKQASATSAKGGGNRRGLRILGRLGVGRTSQVIAVQFAERVYLLGACDQSTPQVIAEMDLAAWLAHVEADEEQAVIREAIVPGAPSRPPSLIDSLRAATARRA